MSVGLGNHLIFGALRGLRVVERPRSGGPLRRVDGPPPAAEPPAARSSAPAPVGERVSLSAEALRLSRSAPATVDDGQAPLAADEVADARARRALRAYADQLAL